MTIDPDITTDMSPLIHGMATRVDVLRVIAEAATSYRKHLESLGWDDAIVKSMSNRVLYVWTEEAIKK